MVWLAEPMHRMAMRCGNATRRGHANRRGHAQRRRHAPVWMPLRGEGNWRRMQLLLRLLQLLWLTRCCCCCCYLLHFSPFSVIALPLPLFCVSPIDLRSDLIILGAGRVVIDRITTALAIHDQSRPEPFQLRKTN